jgi:hypothetical protein
LIETRKKKTSFQSAQQACQIFMVQHNKIFKICEMAKVAYNLPNGGKIFQLATKYTNIPRPTKIYNKIGIFEGQRHIVPLLPKNPPNWYFLV